MKATATVLISLALLVGCKTETRRAEEPAQPAPAKEEKKPDYNTGRIAFQRMYVAARTWAADARPYRLESHYTEGAPVQEGKAGLWRAGFASQARRTIKSFQWSGLVGENAPEQGVSAAGVEDTYNPRNASTQVFDVAFFKTDSNKAFQVAQDKGGKKILQNNPKQPITYILDWTPAKHQLVWHVLYGTNINDARLRVAVNASTGEFIRIEK
jgi:hypothetical protein